MFANINPAILQRMAELEQRDSQDRLDGTPRMKRLRQITPEVGRFISLLAASAPEGEMIEIGASAGYSTLWLVLACQAMERRITTYEVLPDKVALARETFRLAGVEGWVDLVADDARNCLRRHAQIAFCFLDAEKEIYGDCYDLVVPRLAPGGILVADNAINHRETLQPMIDRALCDERVDALVVPIGKGELLCRRV